MTMAKPLSAARILLIAASRLPYVALLETARGNARIRLVRMFSASAPSVTPGERVGWAA